MDTKILENIGLTHNESIVYLTLIREGTSKSGEILKNSGLNSGKIYEILESLKKKGLVSESIVNKIKHYAAAPPSQILEYLNKQKEELEKDAKIIKKAIPEFEKIRERKTKQIKAITYTGFRGIKTAADEALESMKNGEEILGMGITERKDKRFNDFWINWTEKRIKKKITAKHIFSERRDYFDKFEKMKYTESKVLDGLTPVTIDIFGKDKVLILNYNEPFSCIMIYDENTAISFINFFYQLWKIARK
jgi:sugar-specific transcriptional regulator TrmB